jgi:hypothetical protein
MKYTPPNKTYRQIADRNRISWKKIFRKPLENTRIGYILIGILFPLWLIYYGISGIVSGELWIRGFYYRGLAAGTMGTAIVLLGTAIFWGLNPKVNHKYYVFIGLMVLTGILILFSVFYSLYA